MFICSYEYRNLPNFYMTRNFTKHFCRTVARKFAIGGICSSAGRFSLCLGGLEIIKLIKTPLIYSVARFNLGGLEVCLGGLSPPKPHRGDGTDFLIAEIYLVELFYDETITLCSLLYTPIPEFTFSV